MCLCFMPAAAYSQNTAASGKACEVRVNGKVAGTIPVTGREDCYEKSCFGTGNCKVFARFFKPGDNLLERVFDNTDRLCSEHCLVNEPVVDKVDKTSVTISGLPMQANGKLMTCPKVGLLYDRKAMETSPYLRLLLPNFDEHCDDRRKGLRAAGMKLLRCVPDARGGGLGPDAVGDLICKP